MPDIEPKVPDTFEVPNEVADVLAELQRRIARAQEDAALASQAILATLGVTGRQIVEFNGASTERPATIKTVPIV